jgi:hypothetical protein
VRKYVSCEIWNEDALGDEKKIEVEFVGAQEMIYRGSDGGGM